MIESEMMKECFTQLVDVFVFLNSSIWKLLLNNSRSKQTFYRDTFKNIIKLPTQLNYKMK
jgi:hypothetical protein